MSKLRVLALSDQEVTNLFNTLKGNYYTLSAFRRYIQNRNLKKFRITELKQIISFLNTEKNLSISKTGKKQILIDRISSEIYNSDKTPSVRSPMYSTNSFIRFFEMCFSNIERIKSYEENEFERRINQDITLNGHQDCFYPIVRLVNVLVIRGKIRSKITIELQKEELFNIRQRKYDLHIYHMNDLAIPSNWHSDVGILLGRNRLKAPPPNQKLEKKKKKGGMNQMLISHTPLIVPPHVVGEKNNVEIQFPSWSTPNCKLTFCVVARRTLTDVENHLKSVSGANYRESVFFQSQQIQMEEQKMKSRNEIEFDDDDDDVLEGEEVIMLTDPILLTRIGTAVRGMKCNHRQVFDLLTYLEFCHLSKVWNCPHCHKRVPGEQLYVDDYIMGILRDVDEEIEKVKINMDGTYTPIDPESKLLKRKSIKLDGIVETPPKENQSPHDSVLPDDEDLEMENAPSLEEVFPIRIDPVSPPSFLPSNLGRKKNNTEIDRFSTPPHRVPKRRLILSLPRTSTPSNPYSVNNLSPSSSSSSSSSESDEEGSPPTPVQTHVQRLSGANFNVGTEDDPILLD